MPGPVSAISTASRSPSRIVRTVSVPDSPIAATALSMRLVQTWLSSAAYAGMVGSVRSYSFTTRTPLGIFALSITSVASSSVVHIHGLMWSAIKLRILLGGGDETRDPSHRVIDLAHEQLGVDRVGEPPDGGFEIVAAHRRGDLIEPFHVYAASDQRAGKVPPARDVVLLEPVAERILGVAGLHR